eukprot:12622817-Heterocapsa_arctica.AAC.1
MKKQERAREHEKGKKNNTKEKMRNKNNMTKKKSAEEEKSKDGDNIEARTLEEWWEKTTARVLAVLAREEQTEKERKTKEK